LFQVEFQFAEETVARGTSSHRRPPDCDHQGWRGCALRGLQRILSFLSAAGTGPAAILRERQVLISLSAPLAMR
jgi:hypothetical protein